MGWIETDESTGLLVIGELAGGVVDHVPVHAVAVGHLLRRAEFQTGYLQGHDKFRKSEVQSDCSLIQVPWT